MKILKETSTSEYIYKLCISSYKQAHKKETEGYLSIYLSIYVYVYIHVYTQISDIRLNKQIHLLTHFIYWESKTLFIFINKERQ